MTLSVRDFLLAAVARTKSAGYYITEEMVNELAADPALEAALELGLAWERVQKALPDKDYAIMLRGSARWMNGPPMYQASAYPHDGRRVSWEAHWSTPHIALARLADELERR